MSDFGRVHSAEAALTCSRVGASSASGSSPSSAGIGGIGSDHIMIGKTMWSEYFLTMLLSRHDEAYSFMSSFRYSVTSVPRAGASTSAMV